MAAIWSASITSSVKPRISRIVEENYICAPRRPFLSVLSVHGLHCGRPALTGNQQVRQALGIPSVTHVTVEARLQTNAGTAAESAEAGAAGTPASFPTAPSPPCPPSSISTWPNANGALASTRYRSPYIQGADTGDDLVASYGGSFTSAELADERPTLISPRHPISSTAATAPDTPPALDSANTASAAATMRHAAETTTSRPDTNPDSSSTAASDHWEPPEWLQRTTLLLGREGVAALRECRVLVVGLGGVGAYVAEFLVRAGVGSLAVVDGDVVDASNKNRQLPALDSTIGQPKAHVMSRRLRDINPHLNLVVRQEFLTPDGAGPRLLDEVAEELDRGARTAAGAAEGSQPAAGATDCSTAGGSDDALDSSSVGGSARSTAAASSSQGPTSSAAPPAAPLHWVVDCIDSIAPKLALVAAAARRGARVVSSMGAGGRMDPLAVRIADISETYGDPFAAACRRGLRRQYGIRSGVTVVFSTEPCRRTSMALTSAAARYKRSYYGTISFLPALFGLHISAHVVNALTDGPMMASEARQRAELRRQRGELGDGGGGKNGGRRAAGCKGRGSDRQRNAAAAAQSAVCFSGRGGGDASVEAEGPPQQGGRQHKELEPLQRASRSLGAQRGGGEGRLLAGSFAEAVQRGSGFEGGGI